MGHDRRAFLKRRLQKLPSLLLMRLYPQLENWQEFFLFFLDGHRGSTLPSSLDYLANKKGKQQLPISA
ncbi:MAG: hypothetical protein P4L69_16360 [Desulfosporosinus sp.]|nr:hypothetical protein [Desulfosporosinus sp.]